MCFSALRRTWSGRGKEGSEAVSALFTRPDFSAVFPLRKKSYFLLTDRILCAMLYQRLQKVFFFCAKSRGSGAAAAVHPDGRRGLKNQSINAFIWRFGMRTRITLSCTECKQRNYNTTKDKKTHPERLEMKKYCRFCRKHTVHKETK